MRSWLAKLKKLDSAINVAKTRRERRKLYGRFLKTASKAAWHLGDEVIRPHSAAADADLPPPRIRQRLDRRRDRMLGNLQDVCGIYRQCEKRVMEGRRIKGSERIVSLSDRTAAYTVEGDRFPVVGYKPQIARSRNGLVTTPLVPEGSAADSEMLVPLVRGAIELAGTVPELGSFDDGYSSADGLEQLTGLGLKHVSFSGPKGRALLGDELWESDVHSEAPRFRSAVESLIFCLKHSHEFGELRRRGLDAVRDELMGKAIAYNFCRIIMLGRRKRDKELELRAV